MTLYDCMDLKKIWRLFQMGPVWPSICWVSTVLKFKPRLYGRVDVVFCRITMWCSCTSIFATKPPTKGMCTHFVCAVIDLAWRGQGRVVLGMLHLRWCHHDSCSSCSCYTASICQLQLQYSASIGCGFLTSHPPPNTTSRSITKGRFSSC